ncbi:hypothetical protein ACFWVC_21760 [Streptomyces sp. NPDC058691]|uniref:hypothetical protein n=1 Tax=Streptomyces sp. NPDC058691 TaxID=3346601 RepID=UPI003668D182
MRPPEELDLVDWSVLEHAYGPAGEVPGWIRALYTEANPETEDGESVVYELFNSINHQGSVYPATVAAVPFLAHLAVHVDSYRAAILHLLTRFAADSGQEGGRAGLDSQLRAAVVAELPALTGCLTDPDAGVRQETIRLMVVAPQPLGPAVQGTLSDLCASDPDQWTRADALTAIALTDPDQEAVLRREVSALADDAPEVRLTAALLGLERTQRPFPAALVDVVAVDGARDLGCYWATGRKEPFPHPGPGDSRLRELLVQDPQAALTVAEAWIAAGDVDYRGSHLADKVGTAWRDQEPRITAAVACAVPLPRPTADNDWMAQARHARLMRQLADCIPVAADPGPHVRDMLLDRACRDAPEAADAAQLALGRCGDLRVLECDAVPTGQAIAALLIHHEPNIPRLLHRALEEHLPHGDPAVLDALTPPIARAYAPHIAEAFRNRPTASAARLLGTLDPALVDSRTRELLAAAAGRDSANEVLRATAAVSDALLTGRPAAAIALLRELLAGDSPHWILPAVGRLGPLGAPLVAQVQELFAGRDGMARVEAADAYWRITADPGPVVPLLVELAQPYTIPDLGDCAWHRLDALRTLADIGITPRELLPLLEACARSPQRVARVDEDEELRRVATRLLAQAQ